MFEDALVLAEFFHEFQYTNFLIDAAEKLVQEDFHALIEFDRKLMDALSAFKSLDLKVWREVDYIRLAKEHDDIYEKELRAVEKIATRLWQQYQSESNRLDMMPFDTEEFIQLDKKCDQSKRDYYEAHKVLEKQHKKYRHEMEKCAHVCYFEMQFLEILVDKMEHIAQTTLADTKQMDKEGGT